MLSVLKADKEIIEFGVKFGVRPRVWGQAWHSDIRKNKELFRKYGKEKY